MKFRARNDNVLCRMVDVGMSEGGVIIPTMSDQGKAYIVEEVGDAVKDLKKGDRVLVIGQFRIDWDFLPQSKELFVCPEKKIVLVLEDGDK